MTSLPVGRWSEDMGQEDTELMESIAELDQAVERAIDEVEKAELDLLEKGIKSGGEHAVQELLDGILTLPDNLSSLVDCYKQYEKSGDLQASSSLLSSLPTTSPDSPTSATSPPIGSDVQQRYIEEIAQLPSPEPASFPRSLTNKPGNPSATSTTSTTTSTTATTSFPADRDPDSTDTEPEDVVRRYTGK